MNRSLQRVTRRLPLAWLALAPWLGAAEGSESSVVLVADSRRFTGLEAWWANLYNESHLYFALLTVLVIVALGLAMGQVTEWIMRRIGINLKSRVLAEH